MEPPLPDGWTLARVRAIEPGTVVLDPAGHHVVAERGVGDRVPLPPAEHLLAIGDLRLVRVEGDPEWWMGDVADDGTIVCWGSHGTDLGAALRAL